MICILKKILTFNLLVLYNNLNLLCLKNLFTDHKLLCKSLIFPSLICVFAKLMKFSIAHCFVIFLTLRTFLKIAIHWDFSDFENCPIHLL